MFLALRKSGFRSVLAISVVALGIAAMMIMLALSTGAERELQAITEKMGKNLFVVFSVMTPPSRELEPPANPARVHATSGPHG